MSQPLNPPPPPNQQPPNYPPYPQPPYYPPYAQPSTPLAAPYYPPYAQPSMPLAMPPPRRSSRAPVVIILSIILLVLIVAGGFLYLNVIASPNVAGNWDFLVAASIANSGGSEATLSIHQDGNALTAVIVGTSGSGLSLTGSLDGHAIRLDGSIDDSQGTCAYHFSGTVSDDTHMGGRWNATCALDGQTSTNDGNWTATKASP